MISIPPIELTKSREDYGPNLQRPYRYFLAYLERLSGRLPEALQQADLAYGDGIFEGLLFSVRILHLRALITLELGRSDEYEKRLEEIKGHLDPDRFPDGTPRLMRVYYHLLGHRELRKGDYGQAIRYFWKAADLISVFSASGFDADHTKYFYDLAEAYRRAEDYGKARTMYEKVVLPTVRREFSGDLYAQSFYWWCGLGKDREGNPAPDPLISRCLGGIPAQGGQVFATRSRSQWAP